MLTNKQPKIFVVDDEELSNKFFCRYLRNKGYTDCHSFLNGEKCLINLYLKPDIVFLDQNLGGVNGIEVLKIITANFPKTKVVMLTSTKSHQTIFEALSYGAFDYVIKGDDELMFLDNVLGNIHQVSKEFVKP